MSKRWQELGVCVALAVLLSGCEVQSSIDKPVVDRSGDAKEEYRWQTVASRLDVPWSLAFAPDGRIFFTERPGQIRVIEKGKLQKKPVYEVPEPFVVRGEGGLLGLAVDPDFARNRYLYVYHTYEEKEHVYNRVLRLRERENRAVLDKVLVDRIPGNVFHNGGRLKFGPDGYLYVTTGDALEPDRAQDVKDLAGKILRIDRDGNVPTDNPFPGSPVYSYGHRNPQGLAWDDQGNLYASEHGQSAHDEVNRIKPGANYGWPLIQGTEGREGMVSPWLQSGEETWAPSGMAMIRTGPYRNRLAVAQLRGERLMLADFTGEPLDLLEGELGRIRDVVEGPDGSLYVLTNNRDGRGTPTEEDDRILCLCPAK